MNTCLKYILGFLLGSWLFTGCHYADMLEFNDIPRVSFVGVDKNGSDTYDPTTLAASLNFGENLKGDSISCDTMTVRIRLLGAPAGQPLKVSLKSVPVGGWPEVDYANSDVAEGIDTLRHYELTITDEVTLDMLGLYEGDWENYIAPYLGPYSENKARFMIMTLKMMNLSILTYGPGYINRYKPQLVEALEYYNTMNPDNHLKDENGNLISFDPA